VCFQFRHSKACVCGAHAGTWQRMEPRCGVRLKRLGSRGDLQELVKLVTWVETRSLVGLVNVERATPAVHSLTADLALRVASKSKALRVPAHRQPPPA
jgi:hypothetical protein